MKQGLIFSRSGKASMERFAILKKMDSVLNKAPTRKFNINERDPALLSKNRNLSTAQEA
jgi:hypothetical protein